MIELKHVFKSYRVKGAPEVKALDDVSVSFGEKGLVFILGKSGAGKSTMLNVIGGLDRIDSGDIVIMGKSSKDFTQSEFDSYRNTFLGFIFQEYNILNEFTVGQNIALAMQLQGKKGTPQEVNEILDMVDLHGLAERKPNQLSGGQKQRVAIARALIKKPQIIMADEPTGALDSKTGMQIFDTLNKLSHDHLVIVVSHDRDFAEFYGDRVIEMKDGKIISDISKNEVAAKEENNGLTLIGDKVIAIKPGYTLTAKDLPLLNSYVSKADKETIFSVDDKGNEGLKAAAKINEDNSQGVFASTTKETIGAKEYNPDDFHMTKSRLPFSRSFKMGLSSLKSKPFRLVVTALLSIASLTMFGLADTLAGYSSRETFIQSYQANATESAALRKTGYLEDKSDPTYDSSLGFSQEQIDKVNADYSMDFTGRSSSRYLNDMAGTRGHRLTILTNNQSAEAGHPLVYDFQQLSSCLLYEQDDKHPLSLLAGRLPSSADEVLISDWRFEIYQTNGYADIQLDTTSEGVIYQKKYNGVPGTSINSMADFLALTPKTYFLDGGFEGGDVEVLSDLKIVGIYNTDWDQSDYKNRLISFTSSSEIYGDDTKIALLYSRFRSRYPSGEKGALIGGEGFLTHVMTFFPNRAGTSIYDRMVYSLQGDKDRIGHYYDFMYANSELPAESRRVFRYWPEDESFSSFTYLDDAVKSQRVAFFWVGFGFGCFSALLMATFIASSISYKKREIGILRAVGARGMDVYGIFFNEALMISLCDALLAAIIAGICAPFLNNSLYSGLGGLTGTHFSLFAFSIRQVAVVFGVAILTAALASFLPCLWISKKKPIDSINLR